MVAGADVGPLDIVMRPEPATTIEVTLDTGGRTVENGFAYRFALDHSARPIAVPFDGLQISLSGASAGRHRVFVEARERGENDQPRRLTALTAVSSDGVTPSVVKLLLEPTASLTARLVFDGPSAAGPLRMMVVQVDEAGAFGSVGSGPFGPAKDNRLTATATGIPPGRHWIDVVPFGNPSLAGSWSIRSIAVAGRDLRSQWLDLSPGEQINDIIITMSDEPTEISGSVAATTAGLPRSVALFASDSRLWVPGTSRVRVIPVDPDGRYTFRAVNPGDYRLAPTTNAVLPGSTRLAPFLNKLLPLSVPVSIKLGDRKTVDLVAR